MAPRRIFTKSHPEPNPPGIVENPEKILRKTPRSESYNVSKPIHKASSLPENLKNLQDIQFDSHFEKKLVQE